MRLSGFKNDKIIEFYAISIRVSIRYRVSIRKTSFISVTVIARANPKMVFER